MLHIEFIQVLRLGYPLSLGARSCYTNINIAEAMWIYQIRFPAGDFSHFAPFEKPNMRTAWLRGGRLALLCMLIGSHTLFTGCNDDSKTSGTQVHEDPAVEAYRKTKVGSYKGGPPKKQTNSAKPKSQQVAEP
jgi:hypothetical protein